MSKANRYFSQRGKNEVEIEFEGETLKLTVIIPTNYQHDKMMETYTDVTQDGMVDIHGADLLEDRLTKYIVSLPFEVPYDEKMEEFGSWENADEDQKKIAISAMDAKLRDKINNKISGEEELSSDEVGE